MTSCEVENFVFLRKKGENSGFFQKSSKHRNFNQLFAFEKGNDNSNTLCKFQLHIMHTFFQNGEFQLKKRMLGCIILPHLQTLTTYMHPTPLV